jgi:hypothetical protein
MINTKLYSGELRVTDLYRGEGMSARRQISALRPSPLRLSAASSFAASADDTSSSQAVAVVVDTPTALGFGGSLLTLFGVFAPASTFPLLGSMSFLENGRGVGAVVIASALASIIAAAARRFSILWATGATTVICLLVSLITFQNEIQKLKHSSATRRDEFFGDFESAVADATQLGWGLAVLLCGAILLFAAAAVGTGRLQFRR